MKNSKECIEKITNFINSDPNLMNDHISYDDTLQKLKEKLKKPLLN